jgi:transitional endoplasmic reticulum ATPase
MSTTSFGIFAHDGFDSEPSFPAPAAAEGQFFKGACLRILLNSIMNGNVPVLLAGCKLYAKLRVDRSEKSDFVEQHRNKTEEQMFAILSDANAMRSIGQALSKDSTKALNGTYKSSVADKIEWMSGVFGLDENERAILLVLAQLRYNPRIRKFVGATLGHYPDVRNRSGWSPTFAIAVVGGFDGDVLSQAVGPKGSLVSKGIALVSGGGNVNQGLVRLSDVVEKLLLSPETADASEFERIVLGQDGSKARFSLSDFPQVGETSSIAMIVRNSLKDGEGTGKGVNILLCGPSGSGKSEFARSLAEAAGAQLCRAGRIDVSEMPEYQHGAHAHDRLARFFMSRLLARRLGKVVLVVENAEEVFAAVPWKEGVENLLDQNDVVTIWVTDDSKSLPRHAVRRMIDVVEFGKPSRAVRKDIALRILEDVGLDWDDAAVDRLVELDVSASLMERGVRASSLSTCRVEKAVSTIEAIGRRLGVRRPPKPIRSRFSYDLSLVHADTDLDRLADQVVTKGRTAVSFCFYGIPGTGKTAFAHYIARRLDMPLVEKRASDLLGKYVGESEEKIAAAFDEARSEEAFLVINEADSFLQDRRYATQNWESGLVNEMLTWMESHPLPFAMSTNLMSRLDPASLRRFLFKIRFFDMTPVQVKSAFENAFGMPAPTGFEATKFLTPGDFSLVCRQVDVLGVDDPAVIARMLRDEVAMKVSSDTDVAASVRTRRDAA